jgi:hypothetical protein
MLHAGEELYAFVESPRLQGSASMKAIGNGIPDPDGEGVDGLDFLENLSFTNFAPAIGIILGDEFADAPSRSFLRAGQSIKTGQGAYYLTNALPEVPGQRFTQFNRSPQLVPVTYEQNADFIQIALPLSALGTLKPGDTIKVGAIVGMTNINTTNQTRELDSGGIAYGISRLDNQSYLEGVEIQLAAGPENSTITISAARRSANEIEVTWSTVPGRIYQLQSSDTVTGPFQNVLDPVFPKTAQSSSDNFTVTFLPDVAPRSRFFRVQLVNQ